MIQKLSRQHARLTFQVSRLFMGQESSTREPKCGNVVALGLGDCGNQAPRQARVRVRGPAVFGKSVHDHE